MRDEVVRKATVLGLASLPRSQRPGMSRWVRRLVTLLVLMGGAVVVGLVAGIIRNLVGTRS